MTREEALEYIKSVREFYATMEKFAQTKDEAKFGEALDMAIEALHREEAEEKGYCHRIKPKGEWIPHATSVGLKHYIEYSRCSECGEMALISMNFCPNCGADMRGDKNEID